MGFEKLFRKKKEEPKIEKKREEEEGKREEEEGKREEKPKELDIAHFEELCKRGMEEKDPAKLRKAVALLERERISKESKELITPDEWEEWMEKLEEYKKKEDWYSFTLLAGEMKILNPKADFQINEEIWGKMEEDLEKKKYDPLIFAHEAGLMKNLNRKEKIIDQKDWEKLEEELKSFKRVKNWGLFLSLAKDMKLLRPEEKVFEEVIDQETRRELKRRLEKERREKSWYGFTQDAMALKILDPEGELGLNKEAWEGMKDELENYKKVNPRRATEQAAAMKILGSKVKIPEGGGLELE